MITQNVNNYALLLKEQGNNIITVDGIDWYEYGNFMTPAYLAHNCPEISVETAREVLRRSGKSFVRWHSKYKQIQNSPWWCVVKYGPWKIDDIKDRNKRYKIRKGRRNFTVRPLTEEEISNACPKATKLATARYKTKIKLETEGYFKKSIEASRKVPGVLLYYGCFYNNILASFSENYIQSNAVFCNIIRHDPAFLKLGSSYALINGMLNYFLNEMQLDYISNGWRNIYHETNFYHHIINIFGYKKEYSILNLEYSSKFNMVVNSAYPLRKLVWILPKYSSSITINKAVAVLEQETIRRECENIRSQPSNKLQIRRMVPFDASTVANLHINNIKSGFISSLGVDFVTSLYNTVAKSNLSFGLIAEKNQEVVGFVTFTSDINKLYRTVIFKKGIGFALLLILTKLSLKQFKNIFETLFYPRRIKKMFLPTAELLSIVITNKQRSQGLAMKLMQEGFACCKKRNINEVKVLVGADNTAAKKLYLKSGFKLVGQIKSHGIISNLYVKIIQ